MTKKQNAKSANHGRHIYVSARTYERLMDLVTSLDEAGILGSVDDAISALVLGDLSVGSTHERRQALELENRLLRARLRQIENIAQAGTTLPALPTFEAAMQAAGFVVHPESAAHCHNGVEVLEIATLKQRLKHANAPS